MKRIAWLAMASLVLSLAGPVMAANPFADVPADHWAYRAIQRAVDSGVLKGYDGKFHGDKVLNRYQMAVVVARLLDAVGDGSSAAGISADDIRRIEELTIEFADELALLNVKVSTLEDSIQQLRAQIGDSKGDHSGCGNGCGVGCNNFVRTAGEGSRVLGNGGKGQEYNREFYGFNALVDFRLVRTDDGVNAGATNAPTGQGGALGAGGGLTRYQGALNTAGAADSRTLFNLAQTSFGGVWDIDNCIDLYLSLDFDADQEAGLAASAGDMRVNEAYFTYFPDWGKAVNIDSETAAATGRPQSVEQYWKMGGFGLPFSTETYKAPALHFTNWYRPLARLESSRFRTTRGLITPTMATTAIEGFRGEGVEYNRVNSADCSVETPKVSGVCDPGSSGSEAPQPGAAAAATASSDDNLGQKIDWRIGVVKADDDTALTGGTLINAGSLSDAQGGLNTGRAGGATSQDDFGWYAQIGRDVTSDHMLLVKANADDPTCQSTCRVFVNNVDECSDEGAWSWHLGYFTNGGDVNTTTGFTGFTEFDYFTADLGYHKPTWEWTFGYYAADTVTGAATPDTESTSWFTGLHWRWNYEYSGTEDVGFFRDGIVVRYEDAEDDNVGGAATSDNEADALTLGYYTTDLLWWKGGPDAQFRFEAIFADNEATRAGVRNTVDIDDDLYQLSYQIRF